MSAFALKIIALATMTIDHLGAVLSFTSKYRSLALFMRVVGRVAFPIYMFLIAEGVRRTKKRDMYLLRLLVFAFVSFAPFSLFGNVCLHGLRAEPVYLLYSHTNVFFTLLLGAAAACACEFFCGKLRDRFSMGYPAGLVLGAAAGAVCAYAADYINTDYGWKGVAAITATYLAAKISNGNRFASVVPLCVWVQAQYGMETGYGAFAMTAPLLILLYDGSHGPAWAKRFKLAFYMYYPMHITALYALSIWLR